MLYMYIVHVCIQLFALEKDDRFPASLIHLPVLSALAELQETRNLARHEIGEI